MMLSEILEICKAVLQDGQPFTMVLTEALCDDAATAPVPNNCTRIQSASQGKKMSGWQLSNDGPTAYTRYAMPIMEPWTDDLIRQGQCKTSDRVLDVACGTGFVASRVNVVSVAECKVVGIDVNRGHAQHGKAKYFDRMAPW